MTLDEFVAVSEARIPTPAEFVAFVHAQGWAFRLAADGTATINIAGNRDAEFARATAAMLAREPYRTNVLAALRAKAGGDRPQGAQSDCASPPEPAVGWREVAGRCREFGFSLTAANGKLVLVSDTPGESGAAILARLPAAFKAELLPRKAELIAGLSPAAVTRVRGDGAVPERAPLQRAEVCGECQANVYAPGPEVAAVCERMGCPYWRRSR